MTVDRELRIMAAIASAVAAGALVRPRLLVRVLLADPEDLGPVGALALRLFATRNVWVVWRSLRGDEQVQQAYLPVQVLDQLVFAHAGLSGQVPRRTWALCATVSGLIVGAALRRRTRAAGSLH